MWVLRLHRCNNNKSVDAPLITAMMLPARCCSLALAADVDWTLATINGRDGYTDRWDEETPDHYIDPAPLETGSISNKLLQY